jgi:transposase
MEDVEIVIGGDAHKRTHTFVAADQHGRARSLRRPSLRRARGTWQRSRGQRAGRGATMGDRGLPAPHEDAGVRSSVRAGETVARVPTHLMVGARRGARTPGKSDPIDALAVARAAWREPELPAAQLDGPARELRLLVDHRDALVRERTRLQARIRWHLHEISPELEVRPRGLRSACVVDRVERHLQARDGTIVEISLEMLARIRALNQRVKELERGASRSSSRA